MPDWTCAPDGAHEPWAATRPSIDMPVTAIGMTRIVVYLARGIGVIFEKKKKKALEARGSSVREPGCCLELRKIIEIDQVE